MEGQVFLCTWQRSGTRYRVWVCNRPKLAAEDEVFDAADEALAGAICEATGDGESVREYDPPPPRKEQSGLLFRLRMISGQRRGLIENAAELFSADDCPQCKRERGERTGAELRLARLEPGGNGGYGRMHPAGTRGGFDGPRINFFSKEFVARLLPEERSQFQWRAVRSPARTKKRFVEIVSANFHIPFVSLSGVAATLWQRPTIVDSEKHRQVRCDTCGRTTLPLYWYWMSSLPGFYVNVADLPDPLPTCIGVGDNRSTPDLCFTDERWRELVRRPESRGLASTDVGVVAPSLVDPMPAVQSLAENAKRYPPSYP